MKFLVVMDPIERVDVDKDTTFGFLLAAQARGHEVWYCHIEHLYATEAGTSARCAPLQVWHRPRDWFSLGEWVELPLRAFDSVWMRKDPPVDRAFLHATYLLDQAGTLVVNPPHMLRDANEKLYALNFPEVIPPTLVTRDPKRIRAWLAERDEPLIVKPVDGHGGLGIFVIQPGDRNVGSILETLTADGRRWIIAQQYLPAIREGDKRIILIDGEPRGAILRVPQEDDHRGNIHVGGQVVRTELSDADRAICAAVGPRLRQDGLMFVGIDVIGGRLIEVNVTSPTGIREVKQLGGPDLGDEYVARVEAMVQAPRSAAR